MTATDSHAPHTAEQPPRLFDYVVYYDDGAAVDFNALSREDALSDAAEFRPGAHPVRIFDGWRVWCAVTGTVLVQGTGRPGKGLSGDPGPRGDRPIAAPATERRRPVLLTRYAATHDDGAVTHQLAVDRHTALDLARGAHPGSPVTLVHGSGRIAPAEIAADPDGEQP